VTLLLERLTPVTLSLVDDFWSWSPDSDGIFSVNSAYNYLAKELCTLEDLNTEVPLVFDLVWKSPAPSKVIAFSWQLFYI
jgi:hypothetical protein